MSIYNVGWRLPRYKIGARLGTQSKPSPRNALSCPDRPNIWGPEVKGFGCLPIYGHVGDVRVVNASQQLGAKPYTPIPPYVPPAKKGTHYLVIVVVVLILIALAYSMTRNPM